MHSSTLFLGLTMLTGAIAADQVVTMYIPDNADGPALAGAVIGTQSDTTTYSITCADSVTESCIVPSGASIIQAPGTVTIIAAEAEYTGTAACTYGDDDETATCSVGIDGEVLLTSTDPIISYEVTITATETGSATTSKPLFGSGSASATPTTLASSTTQTRSVDAQSTTTTNTTTGADAQETDEPGNGAMGVAGKPLGAAAMAIALGVAVAML
ncbi:uncharacterized protein DSM5745_03776 [Aspergillus mulundensis]|uniref:GPI anchored protein n=1 Tax=Aspergillus mulundensis TaxID=1810919 RepID=A0A3D8SLQ7_9EURO|nr:Uncharacterized protein DSM5745_03776 [Aspergillus mulundensis]RDW87134.1 Uncharacterized protein DSM5745_03776 [Aspergillus mulundensis]